MENTLIHKWELDGIGKAPFKLACVIEIPNKSLLESNIEAYNNLMREAIQQAKQFNVGLGTCDICSTGLHFNYIIKDSSGKCFVVGSECVRKAEDKNLISQVNIKKNARLKAIRQEKNQIKWEANRKEYNERMEAKRIKEEAERLEKEKREGILRPELELAHSWLTEVLDKHNWNFCIEISNQLKNIFKPLSNYPDRALTILQDIYSKDSGRTGSKKYVAAQDRFDKLTLESSVKVENLVKKLNT